MKKFAKMSLVAAVAVAGTVASAQPLAEAIKNVDVSGTVVYRYDDRNYDASSAATAKGDLSKNNYKIAITAKSKVNDDVTAVTRFIVGSSTDAGFVGLDYVSGADGQADVTLSNVYFSYTGIANTTVNVGKQGLTTPWTVAIDSDGNEQTGTGILALTNVGPVTIAGAYFNQHNLNASGEAKTLLKGYEDIATLGVMGNIGPVALDAWYLDMDDVFDSFTLGVSSKIDLDAVQLTLGARHTELDLDGSSKDNSLTKIMLGAKMGIFGAKLNYGWTDSDGGLTALDNDAKTGMQGWTVQLNGVADAEYLQVGVNAQVLDSLNLAVNYHKLDKEIGNSDFTDEELYLQATYKMSKNFGGYLRFGQNEFEHVGDKDQDGTIGRIQVQYSF